MTTAVPQITLNNGVAMPQLGLGTYLSAPNDTANAVVTAINAGYRLIDTAAAYGNEAAVGEGVARCGIDRSGLFVATKLWIADHGRDATLRAFDASMDKLGLDYLDLYMIHWPTPSSFDATIASWKAMQELRDQGRIRAIGTCNFNAGHLTRLIEATGTTPAVNQVELHPLFNQSALRKVHAELGIATQAWSPIGGVYTNHPSDPRAPVRLLDLPMIRTIAARLGKSPAQVVLRWHIQNGTIIIPKSVHADRIAENMAIFDFALDAADMAAIDALDQGLAGGIDPEVFDLDFLARLQNA